MPFYTSVLGILKHTALWLTSTTTDQVYYCDEKKSKAPDEHTIAIYCVHGTMDRNNAFYNIAIGMKNGLPPEVKSIHLVSFEGRGQLNGIDYYAKQLKDKIIANKHKKVILMGHSRGAIIACFCTEYFAKENEINVLATINICGPFGGSFWTFPPFTYSASVDQMRTDSPFLKELTNKMKTSVNNYYYFSASKDSLVTPKEAYVEEHKQNVIELDSHGHLSIMWSNRMITHIKEIINKSIKSSDVEVKPLPDDDKPLTQLRMMS